MTPDEIRAVITFANGIDPRVQMTNPNAELWGKVVSHRAANEAKAAIMLYYERHRVGGREHSPVDAPTVRRIIQEETMRSQAKQSALTSLPPAIKDPRTYRGRNPELWDRLIREGERKGAAERAYNTTLRETGNRQQAEQARRDAETTEAVSHEAAFLVPGDDDD